MKKSRELSRTTDISKEGDGQKDMTEKLSKEGEKKVKNVEILEKKAEALDINIPKEEQQKLKREMEKALGIYLLSFINRKPWNLNLTY